MAGPRIKSGAGFVPAISLHWAQPCIAKRDARHKAGMTGHSEWKMPLGFAVLQSYDFTLAAASTAFSFGFSRQCSMKASLCWRRTSTLNFELPDLPSR